MRKLVVAAALSTVAMLGTAAPASAAAVFNLDNVKLVDGGTLSGTFTTSDDLATLIGFSITSSTNSGWPYGSYTGTTYTFGNATALFWNAAQGLSATFSNAKLNVFFNSPLTSTGTSLNQTTSETEKGYNRYLTSGSVSAVAGAVPEPATWAMMIAGFGLVGAAMRRRAVKVRFA
ncbi:MAG: PEPxxWA-CTERM sorting domain-containing protein [Candidatus Sphingomonas colombiensis]|nr:PEPxxWA-CTERM sorting domain-containing protein [Sphingomonas sp.]WEK41727.1 MAG: PEPxxWA-CTERM sorting domain-containing protein [Sphingomonas sp.]